ncbi:hypothetical protein OIV83_003287 [Microbotryomycetes sp. JL201]|nr:hypothetical protein OIV83_003287 [Microbotryomycetes sp. JL201]
MAPKPRGLKASRKQQQQPTTSRADAASELNAVTATAGKRKAADDGAEDNNNDDPHRTMPLDRDFLSVQDLFELRDTATRQLEHHLDSGAADDNDKGTDGEQTPRQQVQNLCRGILHGCDALKTQLLPTSQQGEDEDSRKLRTSALGLNELGQVWILYLQAWALHHMAFVVDRSLTSLKPRPLESTLAQEQGSSTSSSSSSLPSKKRRIDVNEPRDPAQWLDRAVDMYDEAKAALDQTSLQNADDERKSDGLVGLSRLLIESDSFRCINDRLDLALTRDDIVNDKSKDFLIKRLANLPRVAAVDTLEQLNDFIDNYDDPFQSFVQAIRSHVRLVEEHGSLDDRPDYLDRVENLISSTLEQVWFGSDDENQVDSKKRSIKFALEHARTDALLVKFVLMVEQDIYRKYRPNNLAAIEQADDENDDADDEDAEEDDEMEPLPVDAQDVKEARQLGQQVIQGFEDLVNRTNEVDVWDRKQVQSEVLTKLEEAYQVYSALFNAGQEDDKLGQIEARIADVQAQRS